MNDVYLFCYMDARQGGLIHHFIKHYKSIGIPTENWKIVLHGEESKELDDNDIDYDIVHDYHSRLKMRAVNSFISTMDDGWLVYADLDEFFDYGTDLPSLIKSCNDTGSEMVIGNFIERVAENFELKPVTEEDVFKTFPIDATKEIWNIVPKGERNTKLMLVKITKDKKPTFRNSHVLNQMEQFKPFDKQLTINHFRWSLYSRDCIRRKLFRYISLDGDEKGNASVYAILNSRIVKRDDKYYLNVQQ